MVRSSGASSARSPNGDSRRGRPASDGLALPLCLPCGPVAPVGRGCVGRAAGRGQVSKLLHQLEIAWRAEHRARVGHGLPAVSHRGAHASWAGREQGIGATMEVVQVGRGSVSPCPGRTASCASLLVPAGRTPPPCPSASPRRRAPRRPARDSPSATRCAPETLPEMGAGIVSLPPLACRVAATSPRSSQVPTAG